MDGRLTLLLVTLVAVSSAAPADHQQQQQQFYTTTLLLQSPAPPPQQQQLLTPAQSCQALCGDCGCRGYYCGDECICQCNRADESNVRCIQAMRARSHKSAYPFEVLVQGPAGRRFAREATDIDPETLATYHENERSGRSVYSIYKPNQVGKGGLMAAAEEADHVVGVAGPVAFKGVLGNLEAQRKLARSRLSSLRGKIGILGAPAASENVAAANPHEDAVVGAAAPAAAAEPVVGAAHEGAAAAAAAEPVVGAAHEGAAAAAADHVVGAAHEEAAAAEPVVGSPAAAVAAAVSPLNPLNPLNPIWRSWPRVNVPSSPLWGKNLLKGLPPLGGVLGTPLVGAPLVVQPEHTL